MLAVQSGGTASNTMLKAGGAIDLPNLAYVNGGKASLNAKTDVLTVKEGTKSVAMSLVGSYTGETFKLTKDAYGKTLVTVVAGGAKALSANELAVLKAPSAGRLAVPVVGERAAGFSTTRIAGITSQQPSALMLAFDPASK